MPSRWFNRLGSLIGSGCLIWGSAALVLASAPLCASELALNLGAPVPCGDFACYPDMNDTSAYYFQPAAFELDSRDGRLPFYLIRSPAIEGKGSNDQQAGGLLLMQFRYAVTAEQQSAAQEVLTGVDRTGQLKGPVPLTQGVVAVGIVTAEIDGAKPGAVEAITVGRLSPTTDDGGMAALVLSVTQMARLEAVGKNPKTRIVLAVEAATEGWYPPLEQTLGIDTAAITAQFFANKKQRWTGHELEKILSQSRQNGWLKVAKSITVDSTNETVEDAELENWSGIKAHLLNEWFRPVMPVSRFATYYDDSDVQRIETLIQDALIRTVPPAESHTNQNGQAMNRHWFSAIASENGENRTFSADQHALLRLAQKANDDGAEAYATKKFDLAIESFTRANELYTRVYAVTSPVVEYNLAQCYRRLGKCPQAITHYEQVINAPAKSHDINYLGYSGYSLLFMGQCLIELNQPEEALDYLYRAIKIPEVPEKGQIMMEVGETFARLNKYCPAMETLREADRLTRSGEESHLEKANHRFRAVAKLALADIRQRESRLTKKTSSTTALRGILADYRDYILCAHPVGKEVADINRHITQLEIRLVDSEGASMQNNHHVVAKQLQAEDFINNNTQNSPPTALWMDIYRFTIAEGLKQSPVSFAHWRTGIVAGQLSVLSAELTVLDKPFQDEAEGDSLLLSLAGQNHSFFNRQIELVEVQLRRLNSAKENKTTTIEITPEKFTQDRNQLVIPLPAQDELGCEGACDHRYEVRSSWHYRGGMRVETPWRRYQEPWFILESPHRERTVALYAQPAEIAQRGIRSATLVFHSQLDAQAVHETVTLSAKSPFLGSLVRFPVGIRSVPIEIEAEWRLKLFQQQTQRIENFRGRAFDWGKPNGSAKPVK